MLPAPFLGTGGNFNFGQLTKIKYSAAAVSKTAFMKFKSIATWLICSLLALATQANAATSYQITNGTNQDIDEHGTCKTVTNLHASGNALFVPTNTATEWSTFYNNPPSGVSAVDCGSCAVTPGSQSFTTAGSSNFTVPCYNTLTVKVWGAGGGGSGARTGNGTAGGQSKFNNALIANGGGGATANGVFACASPGYGAGGTASGGTTNTTGANGVKCAGGTGCTGPAGAGGNAPTITGTSGAGACTSGGASGNTPGGGGGGGGYYASPGNGGGGGGYSTKTYVPGELTPGASLPVVVGSGGTGGTGYSSCNGGAGKVGRVTITWN